MLKERYKEGIQNIVKYGMYDDDPVQTITDQLIGYVASMVGNFDALTGDAMEDKRFRRKIEKQLNEYYNQYNYQIALGHESITDWPCEIETPQAGTAESP